MGIKRIAILAVIFIISANSYGQNYSKRFSYKKQAEGTLYYVYPQKGFISNDPKIKMKFDYTYNSATDSVIFNFSLFDKKIHSEIDYVVFSFFYDDKEAHLKSDASKLFIDFKRAGYEYRYSAYFSAADFDMMLRSWSIPVFYVKTTKEQLHLTINNRDKWLILSSENLKLLRIFRMNR